MRLSHYSGLRHFSSWKICSLDEAAETSMIDSEQNIINFDQVKTAYLNALGKSNECMASVDAMGTDNDGHVYMIEFKNGDIDKQEIRNKITESLLIFNDLTHSRIEDTRQNMDFVLVYNPEKIHYRFHELKAFELARLGKAPCPFYDLGKYPGVCVQKAYIMSAEIFSKKMLDSLSII